MTSHTGSKSPLSARWMASSGVMRRALAPVGSGGWARCAPSERDRERSDDREQEEQGRTGAAPFGHLAGTPSRTRLDFFLLRLLHAFLRDEAGGRPRRRDLA